jgi:hypothetical protein
MPFHADQILGVLDRCRDTYDFPMLDNGYFYLAATRLSLFRTSSDWAMVFELFGFSPRSGSPDTYIETFASQLHNRDSPESYGSRQAYENYLANNQNNEFRSVGPIDDGNWQAEQNVELVGANSSSLRLRGRTIALPPLAEYSKRNIELKNPPEVRVFELCRLLAEVERNAVLATPQEQRQSVMPEMIKIMQLEEWHHPDLANDERPSGSRTFRQLAEVLATGDVALYKPVDAPNTDWRNWPDSGML